MSYQDGFLVSKSWDELCNVLAKIGEDVVLLFGGSFSLVVAPEVDGNNMVVSRKLLQLMTP